MPKRYNVNRHNTLAVMLLDLRRHLMSCKNCRTALDASDYDMLCKTTKAKVLATAKKWDRNIPDRLAAKRGDDPWMFPCPNPNAHGPAYAMTAEPMSVSSIQGGLF